jgi:hypothetical protein
MALPRGHRQSGDLAGRWPLPSVRLAGSRPSHLRRTFAGARVEMGPARRVPFCGVPGWWGCAPRPMARHSTLSWGSAVRLRDASDTSRMRFMTLSLVERGCPVGVCRRKGRDDRRSARGSQTAARRGCCRRYNPASAAAGGDGCSAVNTRLVVARGVLVHYSGKAEGRPGWTTGRFLRATLKRRLFQPFQGMQGGERCV